jgi:predicted RNA-binding protein YlxR (DUF448 family)
LYLEELEGGALKKCPVDIFSERACLWRGEERRRKNLIRLGVDPDHAYQWSRTRKGGWAIAQSPIMGTTITLKRLKQRGYISMQELYEQLNPSFHEPLYT